MLRQTYKSIIGKTKACYPDAFFVDVTRSRKSILSPSWNLLNDYKNGLVDWTGYTERFKEEMEKPKAVREMLGIAKKAQKKDVFLVCFEGPLAGDKCHRFILLDLISKIAIEHGIEVVVSKEYACLEDQKKNKQSKQMILSCF
ncbi:hypothetical protein FTO70_03015 [Methanosarcina sp. KYL-1]|uniref:DUF488 family protein, N3 subclade n=1 Tax=Methanosarcina sp. KYL-1 TaxID=2602068 RepID=UPI00210177E7|nr:hypothetical protein [Methanosarcina sp. KYL-1]MCQ1534678.1 hypothetical protein [Methanosarcina sp. KYL-1]